MDIQELVVSNYNNKTWKIVGLIGLNEPIIFDSSLQRIPATKKTIDYVKTLLMQGKECFISKSLTKAEVTIDDIIIQTCDELQCAKNLAIQEINNAMQRNVFIVSTLDCFDYLTNYMKLLANGIFITDENREDKYFEIIEQSQLNEKPDEISNDSSFEEEQEYFKLKQKYEMSQNNLKTLELYLNAYDKLSKINYVHNKLQTIKRDIINSNSVDELNNVVQQFYNVEQ